MASDPHFRDDFDYPRRRGRILPLTVAVLALLGFASIVWYAYTWGVGSVAKGGLPTVAAPDSPEKERPSSPGGMVVPHQDSLVLNEGIVGAPEPQVERLLPPPEEPQPPQPLTERENVAHQSLASAPATPNPPDPGGGSTAPSDEPQQQQVVAAPEPQPAQPASSEAAQPPVQSAPLADKPAQPPAEVTQPAPQPSGEAKQQTAEKPTQQAAAPSPKAAETAARTPQKQVAAITKGSHVLQLASVKSEADAERAWSGLRGRFPDLLDGLQLKVERADLGSKGVFFRVVVGPFPNRSTASDLCAQLKAQRQDCIVRQF